MPYLRITDDESLMLHQQWCGECTRRGAYFTSHHNWFISTAHTDEDIQRTLDIVDDALKRFESNGGNSAMRTDRPGIGTPCGKRPNEMRKESSWM